MSAFCVRWITLFGQAMRCYNKRGPHVSLINSTFGFGLQKKLTGV